MIEAENEMKWGFIEATQSVFNFAPGDTLADFGEGSRNQVARSQFALVSQRRPHSQPALQGAGDLHHDGSRRFPG
jgi:hypothetical protein